MQRRIFFWVIPLVFSAFAEEQTVSARGKLSQQTGKKPAILTPEGRTIFLEGDEPTTGVLNDKRIAGVDLEVIGHFKAPDLLVVGPIHTKAMFVHKDGRRLLITYYCKVCAIRTYTPGKCWCCQEETELDLIESDQP